MKIDRAKLLGKLTPRDCHPPLAKAEQAVADAERELADRRRDLAERELAVLALPQRIQRGEARADALTEAMRERDAAAMHIATTENTLVKARAKFATEERLAATALDREFGRRVEMLEKAVAEVTPALEEIKALAGALAGIRGQGATLILDWPCCPSCDARTRIAVGSSAPATPWLAWSGK